MTNRVTTTEVPYAESKLGITVGDRQTNRQTDKPDFMSVIIDLDPLSVRTSYTLYKNKREHCVKHISIFR